MIYKKEKHPTFHCGLSLELSCVKIYCYFCHNRQQFYTWPQGGVCQENANAGLGTNDQSSHFSIQVCLLYLIPWPVLPYPVAVLRLVLLFPVLKQRRHSMQQGPGVAVCVNSQCHCAQWEDKDSIEEAGMEQRAQDTLTDWPVFVPIPPFIHTTDTVFSFSPLPALSCLALFLYLLFPLPPILF